MGRLPPAAGRRDGNADASAVAVLASLAGHPGPAAFHVGARGRAGLCPKARNWEMNRWRRCERR